MNKQLYIFDFGDTLVSYPLSTWESQITFITQFFEDFLRDNPTVRSNKLPIDLANELNKENPDGSTHLFAKRILEHRFFEGTLKEDVAAILEERIVSETCKAAKIFDDALEGIDYLRSAGKKTAIMSNLPWGTSSTIWKEEFARHGFVKGKNIDEIICCVDVGFRKPNPSGIIEIMRLLNVSPQRTVFIGDNPVADREAARKAGCDFLFMNRGHYKMEEGSQFINSLVDLK